MDWLIAAPFIHDARDTWLDLFVPPPHGRFVAVYGGYAHDRSRRATNAAGWADYWRHGGATWRAAQAHGQPCGIVTLFPQLPMVIGLRKRLSRSKVPLVAWTFNVGILHGGARRQLARAALGAVDRFIVHSRAEIASCSEWLGLPRQRFEFVPLQRFVPDVEIAEDVERPFVLSMGSAHRDYKLLMPVLGELGYPAVVVAGAHALQGISVPSNVELRSGLSTQQCNELLQRARLNVIPIDNAVTASGQVTLVDAMMFGRPVIVTRGPASDDYVVDREDGWLIEPGDAADLKQALRTLWGNAPAREAMGRAARVNAVAKCSDEAIGRELGRVLREVEHKR